MSAIKSVVGFFAHPDDETILAGGIIALLTSQAVPVHVVCATRGEGGEWGDPPVVEHQADLGPVRERELRCAIDALGATVSVLDYVDPVIGPDDVLSAFEADFDTLVNQIATIARQKNADVILTHGADGEYGHPAHILMHRAVMAAVTRYELKALLYTIAANVPTIEDRLWNSNQPAHLALDIRAWRTQKIAAMECHTSQHALFKRRRELKTVAEALRPVESVRRMHPPLDDGEPPRDAFADLLRTAGAWIPEHS